GDDDALSIASAGDDRTPRVYDHGVAVACVPGRMGPALGRGEDVDLVLDRASSQHDFPVVPAGLHREGRGYRDETRSPGGEPPIQLREPEVVADRQTHRYASERGDDDLLTRSHRRRLLIGRPLDLDVEEVELPIASHQLAIRIEHYRGVVDALLPVDSLEDRAAHEPEPVAARQPRQELRGLSRDRLRHLGLALPRAEVPPQL